MPESRKEKWLSSAFVSGFLNTRFLEGSELAVSKSQGKKKKSQGSLIYIYIYVSVLYQPQIPESDSKLCHGSLLFKEERLSSSGAHPRNKDEISVFLLCIRTRRVCLSFHSELN